MNCRALNGQLSVSVVRVGNKTLAAGPCRQIIAVAANLSGTQSLNRQTVPIIASDCVCKKKFHKLVRIYCPPRLMNKTFFSWPKSSLSQHKKNCWKGGGATEKLEAREGLSHKTTVPP